MVATVKTRYIRLVQCSDTYIEYPKNKSQNPKTYSMYLAGTIMRWDAIGGIGLSWMEWVVSWVDGWVNWAIWSRWGLRGCAGWGETGLA